MLSDYMLTRKKKEAEKNKIKKDEIHAAQSCFIRKLLFVYY